MREEYRTTHRHLARRLLAAVFSCLLIAANGGGATSNVRAGEDEMHHRVADAVRRLTDVKTRGGQALLPPGTRLDSVVVDDERFGHIRLSVPAGAAMPTLSERDASDIDTALHAAVTPRVDLAGLTVQLRTAEGAQRPLASLVPPPAPLPREPEQTLDADAPGADQKAMAEPGQTSLGGPVTNADGRPTGALSGVVVFCNAGHGWTVNDGETAWVLQRPLLLSMIEDYGNIDQLNYFVHYLYNAGATIVPFRPVGHQNIEIVLDNDDPGVTYTGSWSNSTASVRYENNVTVSGVSYRFATAGASETATARYTPTVATAGFYPVYAWTPDSSNRVIQTYRIRHSGGTAAVSIDHRVVGRGWIYLGNYHFETGTAGYVEITNQSSVSGVVVADAIRFGSGMGDVDGAGTPGVSGYPRDEEASRYWAESEAGINADGLPSVWNCCADDDDDNVGTAARWSREMNATNVNADRWRRIYIEFHTNAGGGQGVTALWNDAGFDTTNQFLYAKTLGEKVEADMLALDDQFEYPWADRTSNTYNGSTNYGAINPSNNDNEFDATILEVAFHDDAQDAANLRNGKVRDAVARSTVQGIITFLSDATTFPGTQVPLLFAPDPPEQVRATHDGAGNIVLSWVPGPALPADPASGHAATGYKIYRSSNGYGFGQAVDVGNVTTASLNTIAGGVTTYLRVAAYNAGGESMPSETLAVRRPTSGHSSVLVVNGFDRVSRQLNPIQQIPAGQFERQIPRRINSFDYIVQHAAALDAAGISFDSASNEAVSAGTVALNGYGAVVWILGRESTADETFSATEQALVTSYLNAGGSLFLTGTEIGYDLVAQNGGVSFFQSTLKAAYIGDDAGTFSAIGNAGCLAGLGGVAFDTASGAPYVASYPDRIAPQAGAQSIMAYSGGAGGTAAIQYESGLYRVVMFGFPFECIGSSAIRADVMARVMDFLLPAGSGLRPDFDDDGDVDMTDYAHLQACFTSASAPLTAECQDANFDADSDVDGVDLATFLNCLTGAGIAPDPTCDD